MKPLLRLASLIGALAAGSAVLGGCDASPYAASVNGQVISVSSLNHQLAAWSSNRTWVKGYNAASSQSQGGDGTTVTGSGGPGTYNSKFVSEILSAVIQVDAVHQHIKSIGKLPSADQIVASRAVNEFLRSQYWTQFPQQVRDFFVERLADEATLTPVPSDPSSLQGPFGEIQPFLFSNICVIQASAFNAAAAQAIIASKDVKGAEVCLDQTDLEARPQAFQSAVHSLANIGDVSTAIPTSYGFEVLQLARRDAPGFSPAVQQVIAAAENPPASAGTIISAAHVKVNPRYGTWSKGQVSPPQLTNS